MGCEAHRWTWRPETVRLTLIAESHVSTLDADFATAHPARIAAARSAPRTGRVCAAGLLPRLR